VTLSDRFFADLARMGQRRLTDPAIYLTVWCAESGLNPAAVNPRGGASGLNQMMPDTLRQLRAPQHFERLFGEEQLPWIERLVEAHEQLNHGPFLTPARYYHANFFPRTLGRGSASDAIVVARDAADPDERGAYLQNRALDSNHDGFITVADLEDTLALVRSRYTGDAFTRLERAVAALPPPGVTWSSSRGALPRGPNAGAVLGAAAAVGPAGLAARRRR
jgi:hypothetical protein